MLSIRKKLVDSRAVFAISSINKLVWHNEFIDAKSAALGSEVHTFSRPCPLGPGIPCLGKRRVRGIQMKDLFSGLLEAGGKWFAKMMRANPRAFFAGLGLGMIVLFSSG